MRPLSFDELAHMLREHRQWLDSDDKAGARFQLRDALVESADLGTVSLPRSVLENVKFVSTKLDNASLGSCSMESVTFERCQMDHADLSDTEGANVHIVDSSCVALDLGGVSIEGLSVPSGNLECGRFGKAYLRRASFPNARLHLAYLRRAEIVDSDLRGCDLSETDLVRASFKRCDMRDCRFDRSRIDRTNLQTVQLAGAFGVPAVFRDLRINALRIDGRTLSESDAPELETYLARPTDIDPKR